MRGLSTMYRLACEEEQTLTNSGLVALFHQLDVAPSMEEACPRRIDLSDNVLGDAGAAAFFRTLAVMRWVESVNMRGTGVGPRAVTVLCDAVLCTDRSLMAAAGARPASASPLLEDGEAARTVDIFATESLVAPVPYLNFVDLRGNPVFQVTGKILLRGLQRRARVVAAFTCAHPTARFDLPGLVVAVDLQNVQPTLAKKLLVCQHAAAKQQARLARRRVLAKQAEWLQLFCAPASDQVRATATRDGSHTAAASSSSSSPPQWPVANAQGVYRIPAYVPEALACMPYMSSTATGGVYDGSSVVAPPPTVTSTCSTQTTGAATPTTTTTTTAQRLPVPFFDVQNPLMQAAVQRWNDFMDNYLIAYSNFTAAGAGPTAAAQLCLELGADALGVLARSSSSAYVWKRHAERRTAQAVAAAEAVNATLDEADRLDPLELWLAVGEAQRGVGLSERQRDARHGEDVAVVHTEELLAHVGKLLRTLYACPALEASLLARDTFVLPSYLERLRGWYYQVGATMQTTTTTTTNCHREGNGDGDGGTTLGPDALDDMKLIYYRVVASLVASPLTAFADRSVAAYFAKTEHRLSAIRRVLVSSFRGGGGAMDAAHRVGTASEKDAAALRVRDALPVVSARSRFVQANDTDAARAWTDAYDLPRQTSSAPVYATAHSTATVTGTTTAATMPMPTTTTTTTTPTTTMPTTVPTTTTTTTTLAALCTCGTGSLTAVAARPVHLTLDTPLQRPCAACSHAAIAALPAFLTAPHTIARLAALELTAVPVHASSSVTMTDEVGKVSDAAASSSSLYWLPLEFREFVADLVVRQASVRAGGVAFVPCLLGRRSSLQPPYYPMSSQPHETTATAVAILPSTGAVVEVSDRVVGLVELLAEMKGDVQRLADVVGAFEEWYRLQALEAFDVTRTVSVV